MRYLLLLLALLIPLNCFGFGANSAEKYINSVSAPVDYTADPSCVGAWLMNGTTTETDVSSNGNDLTNVGTIPTSATVPSGYAGTSRDFEASDPDFLYLADGGSLDISGANQQISGCGWIDPESVTGYHYIASKNGYIGYRSWGFGVRNSDGNPVAFAIVSPDGSTTFLADGATVLSTGTYYHICFTYDDVNIKVWVNGSVDGTLAYTSGLYDSTADFRIGGRAIDASHATSDADADGLIDEPIIFNTAIGPTQINGIMKYGIDGGNGSND